MRLLLLHRHVNRASWPTFKISVSTHSSLSIVFFSFISPLHDDDAFLLFLPLEMNFRSVRRVVRAPSLAIPPASAPIASGQ